MDLSHVTIEVLGTDLSARQLLKMILSIPGRVISGQILASTRVRKEHLDAAFSHLEDLELGSKVALTSKRHTKVREQIMLI